MPKRSFVGERRDLLLSFLDQHRIHKEAGTVGDFWHTVIAAYIAKFPEDNVVIEPNTYVPPKTKSGKPSKKRAPDQPKPLREVCFLFNTARVIT